jgi:hydrogenase maturation protein HypF
MALSHLRAAGVGWDPSLPCARACTDEELALLDRQLATGLRCVPTSSMGRLFDAVSSLAGICHRVGYDAQAAMELEAAARRSGEVPGYRFAVDGELADAGPVLAEAAADVLAGAAPGVVAARFQQGVVDLVTAVLERLRDETGLGVVTLSGGVFLNAYLTSACARSLTARGFEVLRHRTVPASDAGLALGQVAVLAHRASARSATRGREQPCA